MFPEIDDKTPQNLLSGKERILDAATFRNSLGLGTMAQQNANAINVTGGNLSGLGSVQTSQINSTYVFSSYEYGVYGWYAGGVNAGLQGYNQNTLNTEGSLGLAPYYYFSDAYLGGYTMNYLDGSGNTICTGTPSNACSSYSDQSTCEANEHHGSCGWSGPYCPNWNGDQATCTSNGCTNGTNDCSGLDEGSCNSYSGSGCGASYSNNYSDCYSGWDESTCNSIMGCGTNYMNNYTDCSGFGDDSNCGGHLSDGCAYTSPVSPSDCSVFNNDYGSCSGNGCSWSDSGMGDGTGTCYGMYGGSSGYCSGSYVSSSSYTGCSGSYVSSTSFTGCSGSYYNGSCSGSPGSCSGTASCGSLTSGACGSEAGCTSTTGMIGYLPIGYKGTTLCTKNMSSGGSDAKIRIHPSDTAGTLIDGVDSEIVLDDFRESTCFNFMEITKQCSVFTNDTDCNAHPCYWDGSSCSGSYNVRIWHEFAKNH